MPVKIQITQGDITDMAVDAIVNAANTDLMLGSGVAGAIRNKGGPAVQEECDRIGRIRLGEAAVTTAGTLKAYYVIHAAGMHLGGRVTAESLRQTTRQSLLRAEERGFKSIAFPAIGTGVGGFPLNKCAEIMIGETLEHLKSRTSLEQIYFVLYDAATLGIFQETYNKLSSHPAI